MVQRLNERASAEPDSAPWVYAVLGAGLALGSPLGYFLLRWWEANRPPLRAWAAPELISDLGAYAYLLIGTGVVFTLFGWYLGRRDAQLRAVSETDVLTGTLNRRGFVKNLRREWDRATRYHHPLSLLVLDLDHLKTLNDRWGHGAGDAALRILGSALRNTCRTTDTIARMGGDEFAVLAPNTSARQAHELAERIRRQVNQADAQAPWAPDRISVSIGFVDREGVPENRPESLLEAADQALYRAKSGGRNRVQRNCYV